jgi:hypothetical protein
LYDQDKLTLGLFIPSYFYISFSLFLLLSCFFSNINKMSTEPVTATTTTTTTVEAPVTAPVVVEEPTTTTTEQVTEEPKTEEAAPAITEEPATTEEAATAAVASPVPSKSNTTKRLSLFLGKAKTFVDKVSEKKPVTAKKETEAAAAVVPEAETTTATEEPVAATTEEPVSREVTADRPKNEKRKSILGNIFRSKVKI